MTREEMVAVAAEALHGDNCPYDPDESVGESCYCDYAQWERAAQVALDATMPLIAQEAYVRTRRQVALEVERMGYWHVARSLRALNEATP